MGCYPFFSCLDWSSLAADLDDLPEDVIALVLVADPLGELGPESLRDCFKDLVRPFKEHFVVDLRRDPQEFVSASHRRQARKALCTVSVERCAYPQQHRAEWLHLYETLCTRHEIRGMRAFSPQAFAAQLAVPGLVMFRATHEEATVGITLWYQHGNVGVYHLGAYSTPGYELHASYGLFWFAITHFAREGLGWLNLGGGPGASTQADDGLVRFKRGWATGSRTAYLCGRVVDGRTYDLITRGKQDTNYFPAYRHGEFS